MPHHPRGSTVDAPPSRGGPRAAVGRQRLALLADMSPGASPLRGSRREPDRSRLSPYAWDWRGQLLSFNRAQHLTAARWAIGASPELDRAKPHDLALDSGALRPTAHGYAAVAGGC